MPLTRCEFFMQNQNGDDSREGNSIVPKKRQMVESSVERRSFTNNQTLQLLKLPQSGQQSAPLPSAPLLTLLSDIPMVVRPLPGPPLASLASLQVCHLTRGGRTRQSSTLG
jgi:hypothetical protein